MTMNVDKAGLGELLDCQTIMVMDYWASTLLDYKSYIGMDVTISLTRQSVKLNRMSWIYGHLSVGIYFSQRIF